MRFNGEIALVTGAAQGLGKAIAAQLAGEGARVAINDIDVETARETAAALRKAGLRAEAFYADVSKPSQVQEMVDAILDTMGPIDILVNNAAVFAESVFLHEITEEEWDRVLTINLKSVFVCSKTVVKHMLERKKGCIVNISSFTGKSGRVIYSKFGTPTKAHYCASKAGIISLTKSLAYELAPYNIRVNVVTPGAVENDVTTDAKRSLLTPLVPLGRTGKPEDVAMAVCFLASSEASFITGESLDVNGGILMD